MYGICINCKKEPFVSLIFEGLKTVETRKMNKYGHGSLDFLVGQRVGIIETGRTRYGILKGYATISGRIEYDRISFPKDYKRHFVEPGSDYDCISFKIGYVLTDIEPCEPIEIKTKGIAFKNI